MRSCYYTIGGGKGKEPITLNLGWSLDDLHLFKKKNISVHGIASFKSFARCNFGFVMDLLNDFKIFVNYAY